uniref:Ricin B lectin domain-containing protein n=1 Tax=Echinococcus canadensis TaxID=519352 RepID=A0A915EZH6_9CEST
MELYYDNFHLHTFGIISQEVPYQPNGGPIGSAEYIDFRAYDMWDRAEPPSSPQYYRRMPTSAISIVEESDGPKEEPEPVFQHSDLNSVSAIRDGPPDDPMPHVQCGKLDIVSDFQEGPSEVPMPELDEQDMGGSDNQPPTLILLQSSCTTVPTRELNGGQYMLPNNTKQTLLSNMGSCYPQGEDVCFVYSTPPELNTGDWNGTQSLPSPVPLPLPDTGPTNEPTGEQTRASITSGRRRVFTPRKEEMSDYNTGVRKAFAKPSWTGKGEPNQLVIKCTYAASPPSPSPALPPSLSPSHTCKPNEGQLAKRQNDNFSVTGICKYADDVADGNHELNLHDCSAPRKVAISWAQR